MSDLDPLILIVVRPQAGVAAPPVVRVTDAMTGAIISVRVLNADWHVRDATTFASISRQVDGVWQPEESDVPARILTDDQ